MNIFSDVVCDIKKCVESEFGKFLKGGESSFEKGKHGLVVENYEISNKKESEFYGKPKGKYSLISLPDILQQTQSVIDYFTRYISKVLKEYLGQLNENDSVCIVGLGNKYISADSLGIEVVKNVIVTRNLESNLPPVSAFLPGVLGVTGIESKDIIDGVLSKVKPTKLILIDSLCASHISRLGTSIQITNSGIIPGSGVGNARKKINKQSVNCDVVVIGVPMVIYASTFVYSAFLDVGLNEKEIEKTFSKIMLAINKNCKKSHELEGLTRGLSSKLHSILHNKFDNSIVSLKDVDALIKLVGNMIANAINLAVLGFTKK